GGHHQGFGTRFDVRPPRVDVAAHECPRFFWRGEMMADGAASAGMFGTYQFDAEFCQYACRRRIGRGGGDRLHATIEHQHLALEPPVRGPGCGGRSPWCLAHTARPRLRSNPAELIEKAEAFRIRHDGAQQTTRDAFDERP